MLGLDNGIATALVVMLVACKVGLIRGLTNTTQIAALHTLYDSNGGVNWIWRYPLSVYGVIWNFDDNTTVINPCGDVWQGLTCDVAPSECSTSNLTSTSCNIVGLSLSAFGLLGAIPQYNFFQWLPALAAVDLSENSLTGTVPSSLQTLSNLESVTLSGNPQLTGAFNVTWFADMHRLREVRAATCNFVGRLPCFNSGSNPLLSVIIFYQNSLSGTICEQYYSLSSLTELVIGFNELTGSLSSTLSKLVGLQVLNIQRNIITGVFPSEVALLQQLQYLDIQENYMTGLLPLNIGNMTSLVYISAYLNDLTGPIPESAGLLTAMRSFTVDENFLTGPLPSSVFGLNMPALQLLSVYLNYFTGSLPSSMASLPMLQTLILRSNFFIGAPQSVFSTGTDLTNKLQTVDLSFNGFTGPFPSSIFSLSLGTLSVGGNCFSGSIPSSICTCSNLTVLSLSGITSGQGCTHRYWPFAQSPLYAHALVGSLPSCIWSLPYLSNLEAAGNGMIGSIPDFGMVGGYLGNLSALDLSYNRLTGTIPQWMQLWPFQNLKLTSNKLHGAISSMGAYPFAYTPTEQGISLEISVNRLSGIIPTPIEHAENVVIVEGNLFSCSWAHQPPIHDPNSANYVCGSNLLNISLQTLGAAVALVVVLMLTGFGRNLYRIRSLTRAPAAGQGPTADNHRAEPHVGGKAVGIVHPDLATVDDYNRSRVSLWRVFTEADWVRFAVDLLSWKHIASSLSTNHPIFQQYNCNPVNSFQLCMFVNTLRKLRLVGVGLGIIVVVFSCPLFAALKASFGTYATQYHWHISAAFLSGETPSICVLLYWVSLVTYVYVIIGLRSPLRSSIDASAITVSTIASSIRSAVAPTIPAVDGNSASDSIPGSADNKSHAPDHVLSSILDDSSFRRWDGDSGSFGRSKVQTGSISLASVARPSSIFGKWDPSTWTYSRILGYLNLLTFFMVNVIVVLSFKSIFVYGLISAKTSFSIKVLLEAILSVFDLFWGYGVVPFIVYRVPRSSMSNRLFLKVMLLYFNSIVAPVLAIMLTDPSCFQNLFVSNKSVSISYKIVYCMFYGLSPVSGEDLCRLSDAYITTSTFTPSFFYNYDCYSAILINYSPVFLLSYCFLGLLSPVVVCLIISCCDDPTIKSFFPRIYFLGIDEYDVEEGENRLSTLAGDVGQTAVAAANSRKYSVTGSRTTSRAHSTASGFSVVNMFSVFGGKRVRFKDVDSDTASVIMQRTNTDTSVRVTDDLNVEDPAAAYQSRINCNTADNDVNSLDLNTRLNQGASAKLPGSWTCNRLIHSFLVCLLRLFSFCSYNACFCWDYEDSKEVKKDGSVARDRDPQKKLFQADRILASMLHHLLVLLTFGALVPELGAMAALVLVVSTLQWEILIGRYIDKSPSCAKFRSAAKSANKSADGQHCNPQSLSGSNSVQGLQLRRLLSSNFKTVTCKVMDNEIPTQSSGTSLMVEHHSSLVSKPSEVGENCYSSTAVDSVENPILSSALARNQSVVTDDSEQSRLSVRPSRTEKRSSDSVMSNVTSGDPSGGLDGCCGRIYKAPNKICWLIIYCSAVFYSLLALDMTGDALGPTRGLYVCVAVLCAPPVGWFIVEGVHRIGQVHLFSSETPSRTTPLSEPDRPPRSAALAPESPPQFSHNSDFCENVRPSIP
jgi:Leucine-rich repeat (LRR) protein